MVNNYFLHKNLRKGNNFFAYMQIKSFSSMILCQIPPLYNYTIAVFSAFWRFCAEE